ncbi:MAG: AAA family ATPase [Deltaproteobacteria bacterium]|nr:AAA family ATPase [Deltaproteobacteria bacterium]
MTETGMKGGRLSVGETSFERIIDNQGVYVDKTGLIHDLISSTWPGAPNYISRPRGFGKTLLLDTIKCIFQGKRELFTGLEIERRAGLSWDAFPVIHISLNSTTPEQDIFEPTLLDAIKAVGLENGIVLDKLDSSSAIGTLILMLSLGHKSSWIKQGKDQRELIAGNVVLLIDDSDYPLTSNIGNPECQEKIGRTLLHFFSSIKASSSHIRFSFLTGVNKFRPLSVFSCMNTVNDISLDKYFSKICGFTKQEVRENFINFMSHTFSDLNSKRHADEHADVDSIIDQMTKWHNGLSWGGKTQLLNPLSVLEFFEKKKF